MAGALPQQVVAVLDALAGMGRVRKLEEWPLCGVSRSEHAATI